MIDGIKLVLIDQSLKMGKLERDYTVRSQKMCHPSGEVIEIWNLCQHIVADDKVGAAALGYQSSRELQAEELNQSGNIFLARDCGHIGGGLNADDGDAERQKVLKQVSVVAGDLKHLAARIKSKSGFCHLAIAARMLDPGCRIRGEIRVLGKDMLRLDVFAQLHQKALAADERVQWIVRLHVIEPLRSEKAFAKRRHAEVNEAGREWRMAEPANTLPIRRWIRSVLGGLMCHVFFVTGKFLMLIRSSSAEGTVSGRFVSSLVALGE